MSESQQAKEAGVSPIIIQELKVGKRKNITLVICNRVLNALGYQIAFEPTTKTKH